MAAAIDNPIFGGLAQLGGGPLDQELLADHVVLVVNVASRCGLTPQYAGLESLQARFAEQPFTVLGVPCNQFAGQEPGSAEEILEFCATTYGTSFPLTEKLDVNGRGRHPLYEWLSAYADGDGRAGEIEWNFEKFLIAPSGAVLARFRPQVEPESTELVAAIEAALGSPPAATTTLKASEVRPGDLLHGPLEQPLLVTRIDPELLGSSDYLAFVEDSPARWVKLPLPPGAEVEVVRGSSGLHP